MSGYDTTNNPHPGFWGQRVSELPGDAQSALAQFSTPQQQGVWHKQGQSYATQTIPVRVEDVVQRVLEVFVREMDNDDSWEMQLARLEMAQTMSFDILVKSVPNYVLEQAAPNAPFSIVEIEQRKISFTIKRMQLGAKIDGESLAFQNGIDLLKEHIETIKQATIRSIRLDILEAITSASNYWSRGWGFRRHVTSSSIADFSAQEREMFGAISFDEKGFYKMFGVVRDWLAQQPNAPNLNFCVLPSKALLQKDWRFAYSTEANRIGESESALTRRSGGSSTLVDTGLPLEIHIAKPIHAVNLHRGNNLDPLERIASLGRMTILESSDSGPIHPEYGIRVPAIKVPCIDTNDYTQFDALQLIEKCPRFSREDGSIDDFTNRVIEKKADYARRFGFPLEDLDQFAVVFPRKDFEPTVKVATATVFGEQHQKYRSHDFDVKVGRMFAQRLNPSAKELEQFSLFCTAMDDLYQVPVNNAHTLCKDTWDATEDALDEEWGGPKPKAGKITFKPYGYGSWRALLSLLKNRGDPQTNTFGSWSLGNMLDYQIIRNFLLRCYHLLMEIFPEVVVEGELPFWARPQGTEEQKIVQVLEGWLFRIRYPFWLNDTSGESVDVELKTAEGLGQVTGNMLKVLVTNGSAHIASGGLVQFLTAGKDSAERVSIQDAYKQLPTLDPNRKVYELIDELFVDQGITNATQLQVDDEPTRIKSLKIAFTLSHMLKKLRSKVVVDQKAFDADIKAFLAGVETFVRGRGLDLSQSWTAYRRTPSATNDYKTKGLTVWKDAFDLRSDNLFMRGAGSGVNPNQKFIPTNALIGDVPVGSFATINSPAHPRIYAQAQFGASSTETTKHFGFDPRAFISPRSVNTIGGAFSELFVHEGEVQIADRPNISERIDYIAKVLEEDRLARLGAFAFIFSRINKKSTKSMVKNGLPLPMNFGLFWAFVRVRTMAMILAEKGPDTVSTYFLFNDMSSPVDGVLKEEMRNFSTYFGSVAKNPSKLMVVPDVAFSGYESGMTSRLMDMNEMDLHIDGMSFDPTRLDGAYVVDLPVNVTRASLVREGNNPIPLSGQHDKNVFGGGNFVDRDSIFNRKKAPFPTWPAYDAAFNFSKINQGRAFTNSSYDALKESKYTSTSMWLCRTQCFNPIDGSWSTQHGGTKGTGHLDKIDPDHANLAQVVSGTISFYTKSD